MPSIILGGDIPVSQRPLLNFIISTDSTQQHFSHRVGVAVLLWGGL